ncbi:MAG: hypothetical protein H0W54_06810 [Rubrobacter sp.]|nr:hypothetical protein [Rubrobacter sp.]
MHAALDQLRIVPLERLILHEAHDESRLATLRERVAAEAVQRNPVILTPHNEDFLLLDGAHRAHTMSTLGCAFVLAQLIDPPNKVESWTHLLSNPSLDHLSESENLLASEDPGVGWLTAIETTGGERSYLRAREPGLACEVRALWDLQAAYPPDTPVRRLDSGAAASLEDGEVRVYYRPFTVGELAEVVRGGAVLPAGITRFRVPERVLGVRFPLESLMNGDLSQRNAELRTLVARQWSANRVRRYDEPVVLFE